MNEATVTTPFDEVRASRFEAEEASQLDTLPAVQAISRLAEGGSILDLGAGIGRIAIPLAEAGHAVVAVDNSEAMLCELRARDEGGRVQIVRADMGVYSTDQRFAVICCLFNSLYFLPTQSAQVSCLQNAARMLEPQGKLVIEIEPPELALMQDDRTLQVMAIGVEETVLGTSIVDLASQEVTRQELRLTDREVRRTTTVVRYVTPGELDLMARLASCDLKSRCGDWWGGPYRGHGTCVSIYEVLP